MDDIGAMLSQFLASQEGQEQLKAVTSALGIHGGGAMAEQSRGNTASTGNHPDLSALLSGLQSQPQQNSQSNSGNSQLDLSALLSGLQSQPQQNNQSNPGNSQLDLSALLSGLQSQPQQNSQSNPGNSQLDLSALLSGLQSQQQQHSTHRSSGIDMTGLGQLLSSLNTSAQQPQQSGGLDLSSLAGLLGGQQGGNGNTNGINMGALMGLQRAFSAFAGDKSIALLLSLKPSLSPERQKKVDDSVRILQLMRMLPLIKDTGIFGDMSWLVGGERR